MWQRKWLTYAIAIRVKLQRKFNLSEAEPWSVIRLCWTPSRCLSHCVCTSHCLTTLEPAVVHGYQMKINGWQGQEKITMEGYGRGWGLYQKIHKNEISWIEKDEHCTISLRRRILKHWAQRYKEQTGGGCGQGAWMRWGKWGRQPRSTNLQV